jgi:EamA domain-containing membrane protein RarD
MVKRTCRILEAEKFFTNVPLTIPPICTNLCAFIRLAVGNYTVLDIKSGYYIFPDVVVEMEDSLMPLDAPIFHLVLFILF